MADGNFMGNILLSIYGLEFSKTNRAFRSNGIPLSIIISFSDAQSVLFYSIISWQTHIVLELVYWGNFYLCTHSLRWFPCSTNRKIGFSTALESMKAPQRSKVLSHKSLHSLITLLLCILPSLPFTSLLIGLVMIDLSSSNLRFWQGTFLVLLLNDVHRCYYLNYD